MNAKEIIRKKRDGGRLDRDELEYVVRGAADESVPAYQITAFLMAVYFRGLDLEETTALTTAMRDSGERLRFELAADKHSTGGVGDKVSFLVAPLVAAAGVPVPMISGRSLGHTGGTLDKLESIPGLRTDLSPEQIQAQVERIGVCIVGQGPRLAPADRTLYALRDAASIVESIPLIVGSILSKKAAAGLTALTLDVKVGRGAFMADRERGRELSRALVEVAARLGLRARAYLTPMEHVLGRTAGNALEIVESIRLLRREERAPDLEELTLALGAGMLVLSGRAPDVIAARGALSSHWDSGAGLERFRALIEAQGGDPLAVDDPSRLPRAPVVTDVPAPTGGLFAGLVARPVGEWITAAGGGRSRVGQAIDPTVGVELLVPVGAHVLPGENVFRVHCGRPDQRPDPEEAARWIEITERAIQRSWVEEEIGPGSGPG